MKVLAYSLLFAALVSAADDVENLENGDVEI